MVDNTNKLNTQYNFAIPTTQEEREKIILLAVKMLTEKEGGNITLNQLLSYVDNNLNNLSNEVAQALINKSNNGHNHDDRYYTEDEVNTKVNELKSDLVAKASMLSYEEIMASTPPIDLDIGIPKASVLKSLSDNLNGFSVLKSNYGTYGEWNIDDFNSYPKGEAILHYRAFSNSYATGTFPFSDGHLLTFIWRNSDIGDKYLSQIAIEDNISIIKVRACNNSTWSAWKSVSIS